MRRLITILFLLITISGFGQYEKILNGKNVNPYNLILKNKFIWEGKEVVRDSLVYAEIQTGAIRFRYFDGSWTDYYQLNEDLSGIRDTLVWMADSITSYDSRLQVLEGFNETDPEFYLWLNSVSFQDSVLTYQTDNQTLSTNGNPGVIAIENGNSIIVNVNDADASSTNEIQDISTTGAAGNISISDGSTLNLNVNDADASISNEIQSISLDANILSISNDISTVDLSGYLDNTDNQQLSIDSTNRVFTITLDNGGNVKFEDRNFTGEYDDLLNRPILMDNAHEGDPLFKNWNRTEGINIWSKQIFDWNEKLEPFALESDITGGVLDADFTSLAINGIDLSIIYEPAFSKNTAFNKNFGTTSGTVAEGNDSRILNGQTAYGWGDHSLVGYLTQVDTTASNIVDANWETYINNKANLSDYVTLSTTQTITGSKDFTNNIDIISTSPYYKAMYSGAGTVAGLQIWDDTPQIAFDFGFNNNTDEGYIWTLRPYDLKIGLGSTELFRFKNDRTFHISESASSPGTPPSGFGAFRASTDGKIYYKNDGGTEYDLTGGGGFDINSLPLDNSPGASPYFAYYSAVEGNVKAEMGEFDAHYFSSGTATDGYVLTSDGIGGAAWEVPGGGSGTVTSVGISSSDFTVSGSPITTSGTITLNLDNNAIVNQTALTSGLDSTDELMVSDAGLLKRMDVSVLQTYMQNNLSFGSGAGLWTDAGNYTYLASTADNVVIGSSSSIYGYKFEVQGYGYFSTGLTSDGFVFADAFSITEEQSTITGTTGTTGGVFRIGTDNKPYFVSDYNDGNQVYNLLQTATYSTQGRAAFDETDFYIYNGLVQDKMEWRTNGSFTASGTTQTISLIGVGSFEYYGKLSIMVVDTNSDNFSSYTAYASADMDSGTFKRTRITVEDDDTPVINISYSWVDNGTNGSLNINISGLVDGHTYEYSYKSETIRFENK